MAVFSDNPFNGIVAFGAQSCAEETTVFDLEK
jgi:hypothetical protein